MKEPVQIKEINLAYITFLANYSPITLFKAIKIAQDNKQFLILNYICLPILLPVLLLCTFIMIVFKTISWLCSALSSFFLKLGPLSILFIPLGIITVASELLHFPFRFIYSICFLVCFPTKKMNIMAGL